MRVAFDTNVFVSAVIARGVSRELFDAWRGQGLFTLVVCPLLLEELRGVLKRARFRTFITDTEVDALVEFLRTEAELVDDPDEPPAVTADPDDDYLVALVRREQLDLLVSGDRHLTLLEEDDVVVVSPSAALKRLSTPS